MLSSFFLFFLCYEANRHFYVDLYTGLRWKSLGSVMELKSIFINSLIENLDCGFLVK